MSTHITAGGMSVALPTAAPSAPQPTPAPPAVAPSTSHHQAPPANQDRAMWILTRGEWDDVRNVGVFAGTEDEVRALVGELEESRKYIDPYDDEQVEQLIGGLYNYESSHLITTAAEIVDRSGDGWLR